MSKPNSNRTIGVVLSYILLIIDTVVGFVYTPILLKQLGESQYGLYQLMVSTVSYLSIMDLGLGSTITRYMVKFRAENNKEAESNFLAMTLIIYGIIGIIILLLSIGLFLCLGSVFRALTPAELHTAKILFVIMVVNLVISLFDHAFAGAMIACEQFAAEKGLKIARVLIRTIVVLGLVQFYKSSIIISVVEIVLTMAVLLIKILICNRKLNIRIRLSHLDKGLLKEVFIFTSAILLQTIVNQFNNNVDKTVLGIYSNTATIAVYSIAMQLFSAFSGLSTAVQAVYLPTISRKVFKGADNQEISRILIPPSRLQLIILSLILGGFFWFGKEFIRLWCGKEEAWVIAYIIMTASLLELSQNCTTSVLKAKNMLLGRTVILCLTAISNFIITIVLVPKYGMLGAAFGTVFTMILGYSIGNNLYYRYRVGLNLKIFFKGLFRGILPTIGIAYFMGGFIHFLLPKQSWLMLAVKLLLYVSVYFCLLLLIGLNSDEKSKLKHLMKGKE